MRRTLLEVVALVKLSEIESKMGGKYLTGDIVTNGMIVEIVDEGEFLDETVSPFGRPIFRITVRMPDGSLKVWTMNRTTRRNLREAWGDDTANWVGKKVRLEVQLRDVMGAMRKVIFGYPVVSKEDMVSKELRELIQSLRSTGLREIELEQFDRFLKVKGLSIGAEEAAKRAGLKIEDGKVVL